MELPKVVERFATGFDELPEVIEDIRGARMLITEVLLVRAYVVYGILTTENVVELVAISVEE